MMSQPEGCSDGLTRIIAASVERGPGSAAKYIVACDGARIVMTVLSSALDLDQLAAAVPRRELYRTYFDEQSDSIPITTTKLRAARPDPLVYQQTMQLQGAESSVYFTFENVGYAGMFGSRFPRRYRRAPSKGRCRKRFWTSPHGRPSACISAAGCIASR